MDWPLNFDTMVTQAQSIECFVHSLQWQRGKLDHYPYVMKQVAKEMLQSDID